MHSFKLSEDFVEKYKDKQPRWGYGTFSYVTYKRTYSRTKEDGSTEEFWETIKRVVEGVFNAQKEHCEQLKLIWDNRRAQRSAQTMFDKMWNFKFLPPGRGLWAMGTDALKIKGSAILNNCGFVSTEEIRHDMSAPFCWAMDMLFLGVGVGFDVRGANKVNIIEPKENTALQYIIPDTREGWIEALKMLFKSFEDGKEIPEYIYTNIRPIGVPIKTFGGTSSGPDPLKRLLSDTEKLLRSRIGQTLNSVDIVDIMNFIGRCAVAGNVRRSAELALGDPNDFDFVSCKDPEKYSNELMDRRWASNNSIAAEVGMSYERFAAMTMRNGEPGYIWLGNTRAYSRMMDPPDYKDTAVMGFNPCSEQPLETYELCNLVEVFPAHHGSAEEFHDTLKYAYMYAKTVTLIPTHDPRTNAVLLRNRRIGTSLSGIEQAKAKFGLYKFYKEFCDEGYKILKNWDKVYSNWLCVPRSIKITTVKPSGTVSLLAGATPGVHAEHDKYYFRTIRLAHNSPLVPALLKAGYRIEYGVTEYKQEYDKYLHATDDFTIDWSTYIKVMPLSLDGPIPKFEGTVVAYFPIKGSDCRLKADQSLWEQMENVAKMQYYWSDNGVSATITFKKEEARDIKNVLEHYETRLKAISMLPLKNHGYEQAPYISITEKEYEEYSYKLSDIGFLDAVDKKIDAYCDTEKCQLQS